MAILPVPREWVAEATKKTQFGLGVSSLRRWKKRLKVQRLVETAEDRRLSYREYLKSKDWRQKRSAKLARVCRCAICGSTYRLDVHHLNYRDLYSVKMSDLRVFCRRCHDLAHRLHKAGVIVFRSHDHHSRFALTKAAVKKALGASFVNHFPNKWDGPRAAKWFCTLPEGTPEFDEDPRYD